MPYRLFYWALRGRGEQIRLLLNEVEQDYEDVHVTKDGDFRRLKGEGPGTLYFGSVPMLEDGAFRLVQGPVIMNYLGRKHGMMPGDLRAAARVRGHGTGRGGHADGLLPPVGGQRARGGEATEVRRRRVA